VGLFFFAWVELWCIFVFLTIVAFLYGIFWLDIMPVRWSYVLVVFVLRRPSILTVALRLWEYSLSRTSFVMNLGLVCSSPVMIFIVRVVASRYFEKEVCCAIYMLGNIKISTRSMLVINFGLDMKWSICRL
jgi:hypothetical protein